MEAQITPASVIFLTPDQVDQLAAKVVDRVLSIKGIFDKKTETLPDRIFMEGAEEITGLSKSKIYKLTMSGSIPHKKYGNKLVFSRNELSKWIDLNTTSEACNSAVILELAKSANKKIEAKHA